MLNLINECYADENISYHHLVQQIHRGQTFGTQYNPLRSAAIVEILNGIVIYINFNTKKTYTISNDWPGFVTAVWLSNHIAHIQGSCGTGCARSVIFIAPSTVLSCAYHQYRIESLNPIEPPDFQHNRPLLIDVKKGIYVCYNEEDNIQVLPLSKRSTFRPPKGYYSEEV